jgi:hypothetical protein
VEMAGEPGALDKWRLIHFVAGFLTAAEPGRDEHWR